MGEVADQIQTALKAVVRKARRLENDAFPVTELRDTCKTEGGRLNADGKAFIKWAKKADISQAAVARLLGVSATAVSNHYK